MIFDNRLASFCVALFLIHGLTLSQNSSTGSDHVRRQGGGCKTYMMVGARGTTEKQGHSVAYSPMAKKVLAAVPGGVIYDIKYNSNAEYVKTPKEGAQSGLKYMKQQMTTCPNMVFVLMGYSKGAMVVSQILADKGLPANKVVAAVLFGNPYYKGGLPQNKCDAKGGKGIASMIQVTVPQQYTPMIWDCCLTGDMICQTKGSMGPHLKYSGKKASEAEAFILGKLKGGKPGGGGASSGKAAGLSFGKAGAAAGKGGASSTDDSAADAASPTPTLGKKSLGGGASGGGALGGKLSMLG